MSALTEEASELQARESGMAIGFRKCRRSQWQSACCGCCRDVEEGRVEVQIADGVSADVVVGGRKCWRGGALLPAIAVIPSGVGVGSASQMIKGLRLTWRGFLCGDIADGDETCLNEYGCAVSRSWVEKKKKAEKKRIATRGCRRNGGRVVHEVGGCCKSGAADRLQWRPMGSDEGTAGMGWLLLQVGGCGRGCGKAAGVEQQGASALRRNVGQQIGATEAVRVGMRKQCVRELQQAVDGV
ncbi:hypothetical protein F5887DRAFT_917097 [Amanita rubescens]|nr:hypothetical protein F5887DRAFT_917097 [Amanita rubescens]